MQCHTESCQLFAKVVGEYQTSFRLGQSSVADICDKDVIEFAFGVRIDHCCIKRRQQLIILNEKAARFRATSSL
jgi:hypothetical protein